MDSPRRIMVVVEPWERGQSSVARAAHLARRFGAELEVWLYDPAPALSEDFYRDRTATLPRARDPAHVRRRWLDQLLRPVRRSGIPLAAQLAVGGQARTTILDALARHSADIVVVASPAAFHRPANLGPSLDAWLIPASPVPVWLVRGSHAPEDALVLAAIDPVHRRDPHARRDDRILALGRLLTGRGIERLHVFHAYHPDSRWRVAWRAFSHWLSPSRGRRHRPSNVQPHKERVAKLLKRYGVGTRQVHFTERRPRDGLTELMESLAPGLLILGGVARGGRRLGPLSRRMIDAFPRDLILVNYAA
ncbi:MAG: universal stress protein [Gammaproteobacteria bacterium]|jgi:nucleotide-binding universal stress UspA family protein